MMFKLSAKRLFAAASMGILAMWGPSANSAAAAEPAVIFIVDTSAVFAQSKVGQSIRSQFEDQMKKLVAEGKKTDEGLQADAKKLSEERALLSQEDLQKKVVALQKREAEFQQSFQIKRQALQLGVQRAEAKVEATLGPIFAEILRARGGTVLFDQSVVLAGGADLDISAEVLKRLNETLTTVEVKPVTQEELQAAQQKKAE